MQWSEQVGSISKTVELGVTGKLFFLCTHHMAHDRYYLNASRHLAWFNQYGNPWYRMPTFGVVNDLIEGRLLGEPGEGFLQDVGDYHKEQSDMEMDGLMLVSLTSVLKSRVLTCVDQHTNAGPLGGVRESFISTRIRRLQLHHLGYVRREESLDETAVAVWQRRSHGPVLLLQRALHRSSGTRGIHRATVAKRTSRQI